MPFPLIIVLGIQLNLSLTIKFKYKHISNVDPLYEEVHKKPNIHQSDFSGFLFIICVFMYQKSYVLQLINIKYLYDDYLI